MKIALKIAGSILATISLVFFCMKYIPDWVESYIEMIEWGGIIAFFGMLFLLTFVLFAIMYILLEIGIWVKGQGARNASLVLLLIASFFRISNVLSDLLDVSRVRSMMSVAFESGFVFFIVFDIYIVIAIILLASKRRCGVGSIITTSIFIVLYASLYAVFGSSMLEEALLIDVCLFVSQLLVNIAVTPRPVSYQNNVPNYGPVNVIQPTGYPGPIPGNGVQPTGYPGPIPGNRVQPTGYPGPIPRNGVQPTGYPGPIPGNGVQPTG
ncbi:MAG: hypothetical protein MJ133_10000, partial [Lachnospiraceae bacterium]|nr:hypothetical protein [Lachnospiraceae bacterium]